MRSPQIAFSQSNRTSNQRMSEPAIPDPDLIPLPDDIPLPPEEAEPALEPPLPPLPPPPPEQMHHQSKSKREHNDDYHQSTRHKKVKTNHESDTISDTRSSSMKDEEELMARVMGFSKFNSTKGKMVPGNQLIGAVHVVKKRRYRQYMNRKGGFNRPLDKVP